MTLSVRAAGTITGQVCPICGERGAEVGEKDGITVRECACGVLLAWAWPNTEQYETWYARDYHDEEMLSTGRKAFVTRDTEYVAAAIHRLKLLRLLYPNHTSLLDVGCGTGSLLAAAAAFGFQAQGVEPSQALVSFGRRVGRPMWNGTWAHASGRYDVVILTDVLEHLTDPLECLRHLRRRLTDRGVLLVEMPEWDCPESRKKGMAFRHNKPREHLALYSERAARALFASAGFLVDTIHRPLAGSLAKIQFYLRRDSDAPDPETSTT